MAETKTRLDFLGTPYLVTIDQNSVTLKKEKKENDPHPVNIGYHRSMTSLTDTLFRQGFAQISKSFTVKSFFKQFRKLWTEEMEPFLTEVCNIQQGLQMDLLAAQRSGRDLDKQIVALVRKGDYKAASKLAGPKA